MYEDSILHDRVRGLEKKLRECTPATKSDVTEIFERLAKIEQVLSALSALVANQNITETHRHSEEVPLVPASDRRDLVHH